MAVIRRELARAITHIENGDPHADALLRAARARGGRAHLVGVTGAPGSGKSTLVMRMAKALRARGRTIAILSVDPSSPFTGGAILGDRVRMRELSGDDGIFIRSMASRGASGGIASATSDAATMLDANGFDVVLIETVGAGQSDVEIARLTQTVVLIEAPGMGDDVQAIKAGILEIADVIAVNKSDRPDAEQTAAALRAALDIAEDAAAHHRPGAAPVRTPIRATESGWRVPVLKTSALHNEGIDPLIDALDAHRAWLGESGEGRRRQLRRSREEVMLRLRETLMRRALNTLDRDEFDELMQSVVNGGISATEAAARIVRLLTGT
jgi:LAO/AO transport system kinase